MYGVRPIAGKQFSLRLLLTATRGAASFEDIRTIPKSFVCDTLIQGAARGGLLADDSERKNALEEPRPDESSKEL